MTFSSPWGLVLTGFLIMWFSDSKAESASPCEGKASVIQSDGGTTLRFQVGSNQPSCQQVLAQFNIKADFCVQITEEGQKPVPCQGAVPADTPAPADESDTGATEPADPPPEVSVAEKAPASDDTPPASAQSGCSADSPDVEVTTPVPSCSSAPSVVQCDCEIYKPHYKPWTQLVEGEGEDILAAFNDAIAKCADIKTDANPTGSYQDTKIVGCPSVNIHFSD